MGQERCEEIREYRGHNTNDCYQLKKLIEEAVALGKLAHLVKDIRQSNQRNRSQGRNGVKVINMINGKKNHKRPYEGEGYGLTEELFFPAVPRYSLTDEPIILEGIIEGHQVKKVHDSVGSFFRRDIPSFRSDRPTGNHEKGRKKKNGHGVVTMETKYREQTILRARDDPGRRPGKEPMLLKKERNEGLNRVCAKDMYPFPDIEEELGTDISKITRKPLQNGQTRTQERKSVQEPGIQSQSQKKSSFSQL
ncbi:hypothetical protein Tco_0355880 [Tanacetum coccineum]